MPRMRRSAVKEGLKTMTGLPDFTKVEFAAKATGAAPPSPSNRPAKLAIEQPNRKSGTHPQPGRATRVWWQLSMRPANYTSTVGR